MVSDDEDEMAVYNSKLEATRQRGGGQPQEPQQGAVQSSWLLVIEKDNTDTALSSLFVTG